jgi:hypothetical protein
MADEVNLNIIDILVGIQTGSGDPIFLKNQSPQETQNRVDSFSMLPVSEPTVQLKFSSDIIVTREVGYAFSRYYTYYQNVDIAVTKNMLTYNYNMTTASVDAEFMTILSKITQELTPPKSSRTFAYDFKFSQNQNGSIATGSARSVSTRTARSSGGGGY